MIPVKIDTQAIIVGAGPAGAAASIFLTEAGIDHVIIEKETFPRDKVCGDACSGKTAFVLRKANPQWLQEIFERSESFMPTHGALFFSPDGKPISIPFNRKKIPSGQAAGFTTPRLVFDNFLFEKLPSSYVTIFQNASIKTIERVHPGQIKVCFVIQGVEYEITAPVIIGADGEKSVVRKVLLQKHFNPKAQCVALRAYFRGVTGLHEENFIELHYLPEVLPGYFWIFPLPNGLTNVGVGVLSEHIRKKKINLREEMLRAIHNNPHISGRFANATLNDKVRGWSLPMHLTKQPVSGDNFLLTGDAASLVDPFTGEGIGNALFSGMLAAHAVKEALETQTYHARFLKEKYDNILFSRIGGELKTSSFLQQLCHYPWLFRFVVNKAYKSPTLNRAVSSMFTEVNLRKELMKPSFYAKVLFNK